jgi:uncharacterized membrane protein
MVIFHGAYDLKIFGLLNIDTAQGFWWFFPRLIVFLFLWCVGAGLQLAHANGPQPGYWRRLGKLLALAALISLATWLSFPKSWVYFGTLHCIAAATLLALPFLRWPVARAPFMVTILVAQFGLGYGVSWMAGFFPRNSLDFIPVYPWFWVVLLGMLTGPTLVPRIPRFAGQALFIWPGRHSLSIYLLHQPLIYGLLTLWRAQSS